MLNGKSLNFDLNFAIAKNVRFVNQEFITGPNVPMLNENALSNISVDVDFLEAEFKRIGREHLNTAFTELRLVS